MNRLQWLHRAPTRRLWHTLTGALALLVTAAGAAGADVEEKTLRLTPPRVGYVDGDVSFWRPGAGDWEAASVNIPLAPGDALASGDGRFEVQVGPQAFLRATDGTQLRVKSQEPDFMQLEVTQGSTVLDLRQLRPGHVIQLDTPQGVVTADRDGFYRVDVDEDATRLTVRRAGVASLSPVGGQPIQVATGDSVTVRGGAAGQLDLVAAPAFDEWDRWNYERADASLAAPPNSAVSGDVYGAAELDRYGGWRNVQTYGRVWVPYSVPTGWAPYTNGRWLWDPVYGYSWVDYAPWGWAPFHYGRWVYNGYWAWAPGPVVFGAYYSPALVSFYTPAFGVGFGFGPFIGWTALSWGEPLVPWWGGVGFVGVPCWYGWGGPRVVNNVVINNYYNNVNANQINYYRNAHAPGGLVGVPKDQFGGRDVQRVRLASLSSKDVKPLRGVTRASLGEPAGSRGVAKGGLPDLAGNRGAGQAIPGGTGGPQFARKSDAGSVAAGAPPKSAGQDTAFDHLRGGDAAAASGDVPKQALPSMGRDGNGTAGAAPMVKDQGAPFDRLRASGGNGSGNGVPKQNVPALGRDANGTVATAPNLKDQSAPFDRLRANGTNGSAGAVPKQAVPSVNRRAGTSGVAAPDVNGQQSAFDRPGSGSAQPSRQPAAKQAVPSMGRRTTASNVAAPPPMRGMSKPQGGSVDAYRRMRGGSVASSRPAVAAPSYSRRAERAPVATAPSSIQPGAAAPSGGDYSRSAPATSAPVAQPRAMARAERAPMADFAPQSRPMAMPYVSRGSGGMGGSIGGGSRSLGTGGMGGGSGGAGMSRGGGGGGGARPSFSR